jgi:hypothetical protein
MGLFLNGTSSVSARAESEYLSRIGELALEREGRCVLLREKQLLSF